MMSGVTAPPCGRGFIWRTGKYRTSQRGRFERAPGMSALPQLLTYRCGAANRCFGPISEFAACFDKLTAAALRAAFALPRFQEIRASAKSLRGLVRGGRGRRRRGWLIDKASPAPAPRAARNFAPSAAARWRRPSGTLPRLARYSPDRA